METLNLSFRKQNRINHQILEICDAKTNLCVSSNMDPEKWQKIWIKNPKNGKS